ncbi:MAG: RpiB/LacA/LacB family sugar-phosphate isomerase [Candidatus Pacebacteria bacterium]|nr:RpiB/LacA/LacB family sugar-phosphate isomerase [Candidatus Paceibacterota bacterium]
MLIYIAADHKGFRLKNEIIGFLKQQGYDPKDFGNENYEEGDDYPDFAEKLSREIKLAAVTGEARGILICGSGAGMNIVANKFEGVRATIGFSTDQVFDARQEDDINVLVLASSFLDENKAMEILKVFLKTPFSGEERHKRRIEKIKRIELVND